MHYVPLATSRDELALIRANRRRWQRREQLYARLLRSPAVGSLFFPRWVRAWQEVEWACRVEAAVAEVGTENLSGMDLVIIGLSVPLPEVGQRHYVGPTENE